MSDRELGQLLNRYFNQKVQLRSEKKSEALKVWEPAVNEILKLVTEKDPRFDLKQFYGGSYYERTKTKEPNEFDVMLEIQCLSLGGWGTYGGDEDDLSTDPPKGFTAVMIDQGEEEKWKRDNCIVAGNMLSATQVKSVFSRLVNDAVQELGYSKSISVSAHGPSVTLTINCSAFQGSIDLTLAIKDASWPDDAEDWQHRHRTGWPSQHLVREIVQAGCHLVAKRPKGMGGTEANLFWRYSFSQAEKKLFTGGSSGEPATNRRKVLRILKSLREDLQLTPLTSYHLKSIMLYEYEAHPEDWEWQSIQLVVRFKSAVQSLKQCLKKRCCPHYFIPSLNLFDSGSFNSQRYQFLTSKVDKLLNDPCSCIHV